MYQKETRELMTKSYMKAFLAIFISGLMAIACTHIPVLNELTFKMLTMGGRMTAMMSSIIYLVLLIFMTSKMNNTQDLGVKRIMFIGISVLFGWLLSSIFFVYSLGNIASVFLMTSLYFLILVIFAKSTKVDFTKLGGILMVALFTVIIISLINIFLQLSALNFILSLVSIVIFSFYTIIDNQKMIKYVQAHRGYDHDHFEGASYSFGISLYLDFINLFMNILSITNR